MSEGLKHRFLKGKFPVPDLCSHVVSAPGRGAFVLCNQKADHDIHQNLPAKRAFPKDEEELNARLNALHLRGAQTLKQICACCSEGNHVSLCHNVTWADSGNECECGCAKSASSYRSAGYHGNNCLYSHGQFYAPSIDVIASRESSLKANCKVSKGCQSEDHVRFDHEGFTLSISELNLTPSEREMMLNGWERAITRLESLETIKSLALELIKALETSMTAATWQKSPSEIAEPYEQLINLLTPPQKNPAKSERTCICGPVGPHGPHRTDCPTHGIKLGYQGFIQGIPDPNSPNAKEGDR